MVGWSPILFVGGHETSSLTVLVLIHEKKTTFIFSTLFYEKHIHRKKKSDEMCCNRLYVICKFLFSSHKTSTSGFFMSSG